MIQENIRILIEQGNFENNENLILHVERYYLYYTIMQFYLLYNIGKEKNL